MKPDNEPVFCHSTLVSKHDSKPFEYNDSALDTAELKATMKEKQNGNLCHLDGCGRDADPLKSEVNNRDVFWNSPEFKCSMVVDDFTNINENEVRDSVASRNISSELFENDTDLYTDKNVMECELPELIVCYKSTYHVVKDICVDEGLPSEDKILIESDEDDHKGICTLVPSNGPEHGNMTKESVDIELCIPDGLNSSSGKDCDTDAANEFGTKEKVDTGLLTPDEVKYSSEDDIDQDASKECDAEDSSQTGEASCNATDKKVDDALREEFYPKCMFSVQEFDTQNSLKSLRESCNYDGNEVEQQSGQIPCVEAIPESSAVVSAAEELNKSDPADNLFYNSKVESGTITFDFDSSKPAVSSSDESPKNVCERPLESENVCNQEDGISDVLSVASQVQRGEGESSFSVAGPVSGLITYSGPIAFSGSISLRSDSSTTSTRSFAFPVLQSEWNSSPVRMAKAEKRHFRKHKGWRQGLLCCRF